MAEIELNADTRLAIPAPVMSRLVGDETVLLDLESGMYFGLDGVGQRIWEAIAEGTARAMSAGDRPGLFQRLLDLQGLAGVDAQQDVPLS